ncbi:arylesterase [Mucilaginibacter corticis]|uniref:Arylesterase n=1 Tax=Mucilaginibacter corticis TaxID=2597670 RepID=A0A556M4U2_9SPHI|nr:arylesterase [Mucilaginibacter corticis]TSJ34888.1 arylesterase [Mucilaginibacter corticis]
MNKPRHLLFFGDSLTAGYGLANPATESFPALIEKRIAEAGLTYEVSNAGKSGDTSAGGLQRLDHWLSKPIDVFVLELGINDVIRRIPPAATLAYLSAIIVKVKEKYPDARIALMGMQLPPNFHSATAVQFSSVYQKLAEEFEPAFVPFFLEGVAGHRELNLRDGLHPSAAGYQVIANHIWPLLTKLLT